MPQSMNRLQKQRSGRSTNRLRSGIGRASSVRRKRTKKELANARTGAGNGRPGTTGAGSNKRNAMIIAGLMLAGGIGALIYVLTNNEESLCDLFFEFKDEGKDMSSLGLSPIEISECLGSKCDFDDTQCKQKCPFGFQTGEDDCAESCECALKGKFQGDILFDGNEVPEMLKRFGHVDSEDFSLQFGWAWDIWDNIEVDGRYKVPFKMNEGIHHEQSLAFQRAIKNMSRLSCIDLITRTDETDFMRISTTSVSCSARMGRLGGEQWVQLGAACFTQGTIIHELLHTLGFHHEQSREDRDGYVDIFLENVGSTNRHNFDKMTGSGWKDLGSEYEISSVMHYGSYYFAINRRQPSLLGKGGRVLNYKQLTRYATAEDFRELKILYSCKEQGPEKKGEWDEWRQWSECSATCGLGMRVRFRNCIHQPTGEKLTTGCPGETAKHEECKKVNCPPKDGNWQEWSQWGKCGSTCGKAQKMRLRECDSKNGCEPGGYFDFKDCYEIFCETGEAVIDGHPGRWGPWDEHWLPCDKYCGTGNKGRYRKCMRDDKILFDPFDCPNNAEDKSIDYIGNYQSKPCVKPPCGGVPTGTGPVVGGSVAEWDTWTSWTVCDRTCGTGKVTRERRCNGLSCAGKKSETMPCNQNSCPSKVLFSNKIGDASNFCPYGTVYSGMLNSDAVPDFLCRFWDGLVQVHLLNNRGKNLINADPSWEDRLKSCQYAGGDDSPTKVFLKDVDGDGLDDFICQRPISKEIEVALNNGQGGFSTESDWKWTPKDCHSVTIQDANGDRKPDIVCVTGRGNINAYLNTY